MDSKFERTPLSPDKDPAFLVWEIELNWEVQKYYGASLFVWRDYFGSQDITMTFLLQKCAFQNVHRKDTWESECIYINQNGINTIKECLAWKQEENTSLQQDVSWKVNEKLDT